MYEYQREFPHANELVYLNHAAVAPWPVRTAEAVKRFADENVRQGAARYKHWLGVEARLREQLHRLLNAADVEEIALLKNTSEALSVIAYGLDWSAGDNIVSCDEEFPSNRIVWQSLRPLGVELREAQLARSEPPEDALFALADARTRLLSISSVQYGSGRRLDLDRIGRFCRERGILFCIDAIQSLGALGFDAQRCQADFVVADGHKWLLGPEGVAVFYCRAALRERLRLYQYGWHMVQDAGDYDRRDWHIARSARRFECGSPNMLGIHALSASLSLIEEIGMEHIERQVLDKAARLIECIGADPQLQLLTPTEPGRHGGIVTFRHQRIDNARLLQYLNANGVVCAQRGGGIRFSPHFYTPVEKLDRAMTLLAAAS